MIAIVVTDYRRFDLVEVTPSHRAKVSTSDEVFALPGGGVTTKENLIKWAKELNHVVRFGE